MGEKFSLIAFEEAGGLTHLYDESQCAAAVANGRIEPGTRITVYQSGKSAAMNARDYPLFAALFAAAEKPTSVEDEPALPPDDLPWDADSGAEAGSDEALETVPPPPPAESRPEPVRRTDLLGESAPPD